MARRVVVFSCSWQPEQTDCRECSVCRDMIVSDMWRLIVTTESNPEISVTQSDDPQAFKVDIRIDRKKRQTEVIICASCHEVIKYQ